MSYKRRKRLSARTKYLIGLVIMLAIFIWWRVDLSITEWKAGEELIEVSLIRVVDGDTIVVKKGIEELKVRLIGIDAPESVHSDELKNTEEGDAASEHLKGMLKSGQIIYIQYDVEHRDIYGRELAYVWFSNEVDIENKSDIEENMLNAILVKEGYAESKRYPPNTRYFDVIDSLDK